MEAYFDISKSELYYDQNFLLESLIDMIEDTVTVGETFYSWFAFMGTVEIPDEQDLNQDSRRNYLISETIREFNIDNIEEEIYPFGITIIPIDLLSSYADYLLTGNSESPILLDPTSPTLDEFIQLMENSVATKQLTIEGLQALRQGSPWTTAALSNAINNGKEKLANMLKCISSFIDDAEMSVADKIQALFTVSGYSYVNGVDEGVELNTFDGLYTGQTAYSTVIGVLTEYRDSAIQIARDNWNDSIEAIKEGRIVQGLKEAWGRITTWFGQVFKVAKPMIETAVAPIASNKSFDSTTLRSNICQGLAFLDTGLTYNIVSHDILDKYPVGEWYTITGLFTPITFSMKSPREATIIVPNALCPKDIDYYLQFSGTTQPLFAWERYLSSRFSISGKVNPTTNQQFKDMLSTGQAMHIYDLATINTINYAFGGGNGLYAPSMEDPVEFGDVRLNYGFSGEPTNATFIKMVTKTGIPDCSSVYPDWPNQGVHGPTVINGVWIPSRRWISLPQISEGITRDDWQTWELMISYLFWLTLSHYEVFGSAYGINVVAGMPAYRYGFGILSDAEVTQQALLTLAAAAAVVTAGLVFSSRRFRNALSNTMISIASGGRLKALTNKYSVQMALTGTSSVKKSQILRAYASSKILSGISDLSVLSSTTSTISSEDIYTLISGTPY